MKRCFIVLDENFEFHKHPVFTGDVAFDLGGEQEVTVCTTHNVREFTGTGEVIVAVQDYLRSTPKEEIEPVGSFIVVERFTFSDIATNKSKSKNVVSKSKTK